MVKIKNTLYTTSAIFILLILALVVVFVYPTIKAIKNSHHEILADKSKEASFSMQNIELDSFKEKYPEYETNLQKIDQLVVDEKNPVEFIRFLESVAQNSNIRAEVSIADSGNAQKKASDNTVFQVSAKGSFSDVVRFAEKLESGHYLITVTNLIIRKSSEIAKEKSKSASVDAYFTIKVASK